jgi:ABC-type sugar transport system permease subunit
MSAVSGTGNAREVVVAPRARRKLLRRLDAKLSPYLFISPFFLIFGVFGLFPLGYTAYVSLTDRNLLAPVSHFIGLHNYALLLHDSYFWRAVENTFGIWFLSTVPQLLLALVIAHVLNTKLRARTFFRMAILLPQVTSLALAFGLLLDGSGHAGSRDLLRSIFGGHRPISGDCLATAACSKPSSRRTIGFTSCRPTRRLARDRGA